MNKLRTNLLSSAEARRAIYVDFESLATTPPRPALLGVLISSHYGRVARAGLRKIPYRTALAVSDSRTTTAGAADPNTTHFTGRENDGTGLYHYRRRYYSPAQHRFLSEDPLGFGAGDGNFYAYVGNSPTNATDPTGEIAWVGAIIGGGGNLAYQLYQNGGNMGCVNWWEVGSWGLTGSGAGMVARGGLTGVGHFFWDARSWGMKILSESGG